MGSARRIEESMQSPLGFVSVADVMKGMAAVEYGHCERCQRVVSVFLVRTICGNGAQAVYKVCTANGKPHRITKDGRNVAHAHLERWGVKLEEIPVLENHATIGCEVAGCRNPGIEMHHIAPRSIWGADADNWPMFNLCVAHHGEWHRRTGVALGEILNGTRRP